MWARYQELRTFDALDALVTHLGALREERTHVLVISNGWQVFTENLSLLAPPGEPRLPQPPIGGRGREGTGVITNRGAVTLTERASRECEDDLLSLASLDHRHRLRDIAANASRHNVTLHPISPAGMTIGTAAPGAPVVRTTSENTTPFERQAALRGLADETGGIAVVNTNNLEGNLRRLVESTSAYYLLGYTSTNGALDGRYRRITTRVSRPGATVRARPGYTAATPVEARAPAAPAAPDPIGTALARLGSSPRNSGNDDLVFLRRGPATGRAYVRATDPRYRRDERLRLELRATAAAPATARLLDRKGGPLTVPATVTERDDGRDRWIVVDVTLAPLAQADYLIEVAHGDAVTLTAFRIVP